MNTSSTLSLDQIATFAPAVKSATPDYSRVKDNYKHYNTADLIDIMEQEGFYPVKASQVKVRKNREVRQNFVKHAIVFRDQKVNEETGCAAQIVIVNSHDGSTSYKLYFGLYRFVCANGLMIGSEFANERICHRGDKNTIDEIVRISRDFASNASAVNKQIETWNGIELSYDEQLAFAERAIELKYGKENKTYKPEDFLEAHNVEDTDNNTLWSTFNRVQENMIKGGVQGVNQRGRRVRTRAITNINRNINLNRDLWNLAKEYELVAA